MKRFMKKWWLEFTMPDGREWSGFFNTFAENREDFPETIKGSFFSFRGEGRLGFGSYGLFILDGQTEEEAQENEQYVYGDMRPKPYYAKAHNMAEAQRVFDSIQPLSSWERVERRIEDCFVPEKTYVMAY